MAVGGIAATVVGARVLSIFLRHQFHLPAAVYIVIFYTAVFGGLWFTCLTVCRKHATGHPAVDLGLTAKPGDVGPAVLAYVVAFIARAVVIAPWIGHTDRIRHLTEGLRDVSAVAFAAFAVAAVVFAPVVEELAFRGMLRKTLTTRFGPTPALLLQALAFGLYHTSPGLGWQNVPYVLSLVVAGVVLGYLAQRYGRLGPGICCHVITNALAVLVLASTR
jgi:membrane protease YdiL (CAAX protease family)